MMANLTRRWWMFNDWEKDVIHEALEYRYDKKIPVALVPFYDIQDVEFAVEMHRLMRLVYVPTKYNRLECKLGIAPILSLIIRWLLRTR